MKAEYMTDVEQTIYVKEFMQCKRVKVITRSGYKSQYQNYQKRENKIYQFRQLFIT